MGKYAKQAFGDFSKDSREDVNKRRRYNEMSLSNKDIKRLQQLRDKLKPDQWREVNGFDVGRGIFVDEDDYGYELATNISKDNVKLLLEVGEILAKLPETLPPPIPISKPSVRITIPLKTNTLTSLEYLVDKYEGENVTRHVYNCIYNDILGFYHNQLAHREIYEIPESNFIRAQILLTFPDFHKLSI